MAWQSLSGMGGGGNGGGGSNGDGGNQPNQPQGTEYTLQGMRRLGDDLLRDMLTIYRGNALFADGMAST